jgi:uncharacterized protein (DUF983 family)
MSVFSKGSKFHSVAHLKCPRCQEGDLFETPTFSFRKSFDMPKNCPNCDQRYELESGFYYGAMFISYILTAFMMFGFFAILKFLLGLSITVSFVVCTLAITFLFIWIFRVSRAVWINFFVDFRKPKVQ